MTLKTPVIGAPTVLAMRDSYGVVYCNGELVKQVLEAYHVLASALVEPQDEAPLCPAYHVLHAGLRAEEHKPDGLAHVQADTVDMEAPRERV